MHSQTRQHAFIAKELVTITPAALSSHVLDILNALLTVEERMVKQTKIKVFKPRRKYSMLNYEIEFKVPLVRLTLANSDTKTYIYAFFEPKPCDEGGMGKIYNVIGLLEKKNKTYEYTAKNDFYIIKKQKLNKNKIDNLSELNKLENEIGQIAGITFCKLTIEKKQQVKSYSYMMLHKLPGQLFSNILQHVAHLNVEKRLQISLNLIKELQQLHDKGIYHGDIKPENILMEVTNLNIHYIDFGFSKKTIHLDENKGGTYLWAAPELCTEEIFDQKSDIFSLGLVLRLLWQDLAIENELQNLQNASEQYGTSDAFRKYRFQDYQDNPLKLVKFKSPLNEELPTYFKLILKHVLQSMTAFKKDNRINLSAAFLNLESLQLIMQRRLSMQTKHA